LPAPIIVAPDQTTAEARVGETIVFDQPDPANTTISTDRPDVLDLTQGSDDGSALFNPAASALAPGVAVVTIEADDGTTTQVTVTVR
jgi:PBP1b-binding outer membrane lipoprotein LpoB